MTIKLVMRRGGVEVGEYVFAQQEVSIGRASSNVLVIDDPDKQVSGRHASLVRSDGEWFLCDQNSTNGTLVGGQALKPGDRVLIREGDVFSVGDFELQFLELAVPSAAEQTLVHFDATRVADRLRDRLHDAYADGLGAAPAAREAGLAQLLRRELGELAPEQQRAVLLALKGGGADVSEVGAREELYRAGREVLGRLNDALLGEADFRRAEDAGRFGQMLLQTVKATLEWLARSLEGRREFETQFGAHVTMLLSLESNPLKGGQDAEAIAKYLLDWRSGRDLARVRHDLDAAFRDLSLHQLGLLSGAQEAVRAVLQRLSPESIEEMASSRSKGWLKVLPGGSREWDYFKQAFAELMEEQTRVHEELISPNIRKGYLAVHAKLMEADGAQGAGSS